MPSGGCGPWPPGGLLIRADGRLSPRGREPHFGEQLMRVFVTGGTGLVGSRLIRALVKRGDAVIALTRRPETARTLFGEGITIVGGDPTATGDWVGATADCDAIIHLAGENVFAHRWSETFRNLLRTSRVHSTENVVKALAQHPRTSTGQPKVLVNASAIGFY